MTAIGGEDTFAEEYFEAVKFGFANVIIEVCVEDVFQILWVEDHYLYRCQRAER